MKLKKLMTIALAVILAASPAVADDLNRNSLDYGAKMYDWTRHYEPKGEYRYQQERAVEWKRELLACRRAVENLNQIINERNNIIRESTLDNNGYGWIVYPGPDAYHRDLAEIFSIFDDVMNALVLRKDLKRADCYAVIEQWDRDKFHCLFQNVMDNRSGDNEKCVPEVYARYVVPGGEMYSRGWSN